MKKIKMATGWIDPNEKADWREYMVIDGFDKLWPWICWVIRQHIKREALNGQGQPN